MKLIVAGSRSITSLGIVLSSIRKVMETTNVTEIVSGTARGVDKLGEQAAEILKLPVKRFYPQWTNPNGTTNIRAGFERNARMGAYADCLLAVWDGKSTGTKHMMNYMKSLGKPVIVEQSTPRRMQFDHYEL